MYFLERFLREGLVIVWYFTIVELPLTAWGGH